MKQKTTYLKVGVFVLLCGAALIAGLLYVGADTLRGEVIRVETYINESVQGLSVGSAVLYRGVNIGRVERITFVQAEYPMDPTSKEFERFGRYVMVVMALNPRSFPGLKNDPEDDHRAVAKSGSDGPAIQAELSGHHRSVVPGSRLCNRSKELSGIANQPRWTERRIFISIIIISIFHCWLKRTFTKMPVLKLVCSMAD